MISVSEPKLKLQYVIYSLIVDQIFMASSTDVIFTWQLFFFSLIPFISDRHKVNCIS